MMQSIVRRQQVLSTLMRLSAASETTNVSVSQVAIVRNTVKAVARQQRRCVATNASSGGKHRLSSVAATLNDSHDEEESDNNEHKHCATCTCEQHEEEESLPPPLPKPTYSVYKRVLPSRLTALSSTKGRRYLMEALDLNLAECYWALSEHFINQSDPAYCGVTTLIMVLNAMSVDPQVRWRGGWRYYGSEDVLLSRCCISSERVKRVGITMEEFALLSKCQGVNVTSRQPNLEEKNDDNALLNQFRNDIVQMVQGPTTDTINRHGGILVVSFARSALGQTGDGHFSPIAAYHTETDQVLLLDVARFKYAPYWVSVKDLYEAMKPLDPSTNKPRGWFLLMPPRLAQQQQRNNGLEIKDENRRPVEIVPEFDQGDICPVGKIKVEYCSAREGKEPTT